MNSINIEDQKYCCSKCGNLISKDKLFYHDPFLVSTHLYAKAVEDSAKYAQENMKNVMIFFDEKAKYFDYALDRISSNGIIAEFGVWMGSSINYISSVCRNRIIYGFDSFLGLQEDFNGFGYLKGHFNMWGNLPEVNGNVMLIKGFFKETLVDFLKNNNEHFSFINIDCDTYESTQYILNTIGAERIKPGTVISFDEYFGYWGWENNEYKAWQEFCNTNKIRYEYLALNHMSTLVRVI